MRTNSVVCQHGPLECFGNRIFGCLKHATQSNSTVYMPFITCAETYINSLFVDPNVDITTMLQTTGGWEHIVNAQCAQALPSGLSGFVLNCAQPGSLVGDQIECHNAAQTNHLHPSHGHTPWITIDGVHSTASDDAADHADGLKAFLNVLYPAHLKLHGSAMQSEQATIVPS